MHGIVRTDNMAGTALGEYLVSFKYEPSATATDIDNGCFVAVGGLKTNEREVRTATTPAKNTALGKLALVASEEVDVEHDYAPLGDFYNKAGKVCRGYLLHSKDIFSITADAFTKGSDVTPTVGTSILEAGDGAVKGSLVNSATASTTKIASLIAIETQGATTWYVWQVD